MNGLELASTTSKYKKLVDEACQMDYQQWLLQCSGEIFIIKNFWRKKSSLCSHSTPVFMTSTSVFYGGLTQQLRLDRHRCTSLSLSLSLSGVSVCSQGVPQSQVFSQVSGSRSFLEGTPVLAGEYSCPCQGVPQFQLGVPQDRVPPCQESTGVPHHPGQDGVPLGRAGVPPSQDLGYPPKRTAEQVLATQWVVCLLCSRRRTFLLMGILHRMPLLLFMM